MYCWICHIRLIFDSVCGDIVDVADRIIVCLYGSRRHVCQRNQQSVPVHTHTPPHTFSCFSEPTVLIGINVSEINLVAWFPVYRRHPALSPTTKHHRELRWQQAIRLAHTPWWQYLRHTEVQRQPVTRWCSHHANSFICPPPTSHLSPCTSNC